MDKLFKLEIGSHYFLIKNPTGRAYGLINTFMQKYAIKKFVSEKGRTVLKVVNYFGSRTANEKEYRFHIGQLPDFMMLLSNNSVSEDRYTTTHVGLYVPKSVSMKVKSGWDLRDYQLNCKDFILEDHPDDLKSKLVSLPTGTGKALPLYNYIKTPSGWMLMGSITVGDIVTASDGVPATVLGVYPQGTTKICALTFEDGRTTDACVDHLWFAYTKEHVDGTLIDTKHLMDLLQTESIQIDLPITEEHPDSKLPIDPYLLGSQLAADVLSVKDLSLYLDASIVQRKELLRGLLDVGGVRGSEGVVYHHSKDETLMLQMQYLVRSLSGLATLTKKVTGTITQFKLKIKYPPSLKISLTSIEPKGETETTCISVDHPSHLFITNDFIVTHNTVVGLSTLATLQQKIFICVLPTYMEKWGKDVTGILNVKPKDIMMIRGSDQLKGLISAAKTSKVKQKVYIVSLATMRNYFKAYEKYNGDLEEYGYDAAPDEIYKLLDIGTMLIDEVHQHLHAVYKLTSYANVPRVLGLSATLLSDDPQIEQMQHLMFPKEIRYEKIKMKKYIKVYAISYRFKDIRASKIQTTEFRSRNYSHVAFERSILKQKQTTKNYMSLVADLVRIGYHETYKPGDKLIIFAASKIMCQAIVDYLKVSHPDYDTRKYTEEDPYENAIDADIRVTTLQSAGTALDIPNLRTTILTNSVSSSVSNIQCLGRLRELKERDVKFFYMFSSDIPKQVQYHKQKLELFYERVASLKELECPILI